MKVNPGHKNKKVATDQIKKYMDQNLQKWTFQLYISTSNSLENNNKNTGFIWQVAKEDVPDALQVMNPANNEAKALFTSVAYKLKYNDPNW